LPDLTVREAVVVVPLVALALFMGVASPLFTRLIEPSADALVRTVREAPSARPATPARRPSTTARAEAAVGD
jgi:NADH:ubiquinone oxidoreductase subunit 4 (subunit M)